VERRRRESVARVVALVSFVIVGVLLVAIGWLVIRDRDSFDEDDLGARASLVAT